MFSKSNRYQYHIRSISSIYKITSFLGLTPRYDFEKAQIVHSIKSQVQGLTILLVLFAGTIFSYSAITDLLFLYNSTDLVLDIINKIFLFLSACAAILNATFFKRKSWIKLNNNLQKVDQILNFRNVQPNKKCSFALIVFLCTMSLYIVISLWAWYLWSDLIDKWDALKLYMIQSILFLYQIALANLITNIAFAFKTRYKNLIIFLKQEIQFEKNVGTSITTAVKLSRILADSVKYFNNYFGWIFIFMSGRSVVQILSSLNFIPLKIRHFADFRFPVDEILFGVYSLVRRCKQN